MSNPGSTPGWGGGDNFPCLLHVPDQQKFVAFFRTNLDQGDRVPFVLMWYPSHLPTPEPVDAEHALQRTEEYWLEWSGGCGYDGEWSEPVRSSHQTVFPPSGSLTQ